MEEDKEEVKSFKDLGVCDQLIEACDNLGWKHPSKIQAEAIPHALEGKDLIGLAQTGSGKTGAFALPILQALLETPQAFFACVLSPTRELAIQIAEQFEALGSGIGVKCAVLVGGVDNVQQSIALGKRPHIVVATPGRLLDHLSNTKGFSLRTLKFLVLDEADRLLNEDFEKAIDELLSVIPRERNTYLYSATMTKKVRKLQRACLRNPVKIEAASKYSTVDSLKQQYLFVPAKHKVSSYSIWGFCCSSFFEDLEIGNANRRQCILSTVLIFEQVEECYSIIPKRRCDSSQQSAKKEKKEGKRT
ncbi:hypothetical protein ACSBR2_023832 [Camellia fascicularis]